MSGRALVVGASGATGEAVAHALLRRDWRVSAAMRRPRVDAAARLVGAGADIVRVDLADASAFAKAAQDCDALVFATHLALTANALADVDPGGRRVAAFSSNNVAIDAAAASYRALADAEDAVRARAPAAILLRPTLIYGDPRLPTLTRLLHMAKSWPVLPMPGSGRARVQPVYHADLGAAAAGLVDAGASGVYAVGGPEVVTMRALFEAVAQTVGRTPPILPVAGPLLALAAALRLGGFTAEQAARAEHDRIAVEQTPLPPALAPRTKLQSGLDALWSAMERTTG